MCSRIKYETGTGIFITGRGMDWNDPTAETDLWVFPKGMQRDGGIGKDPVKWTSKYGSVVASSYGAATADGMNEKGLVGNVLYLAEADIGDPANMAEDPGPGLLCRLDALRPENVVGVSFLFGIHNYQPAEEAT